MASKIEKHNNVSFVIVSTSVRCHAGRSAFSTPSFNRNNLGELNLRYRHRFLIALILLATTVTLSVAQKSSTRNVTSLVAPIYSYENENGEFIGATINPDSILDITFSCSDLDGIAFEPTAAPTGMARLSTVLGKVFSRSEMKDILQRMPTIKRVRIIFKCTERQVDRYGNESSTKSVIKCRMEIKRETIKKINWDYANQALTAFQLTGNSTTLLNMLDAHYFDPLYFKY